VKAVFSESDFSSDGVQVKSIDPGLVLKNETYSHVCRNSVFLEIE